MAVADTLWVVRPLLGTSKGEPGQVWPPPSMRTRRVAPAVGHSHVRVETSGANGRTAMHVAADRGLAGAFVLARHGADVTRKDAAGETPYDLALVPAPGATVPADELRTFAQWFQSGGSLDTLAAKVRASGTPMSDEAARDLIETLETTPR